MIPAARSGLVGFCRAIDNQGDYEIVDSVTERVDEVIKEDVIMLKMDVEGYEHLVHASAARLFEEKRWGFLLNRCCLHDLGVYMRAINVRFSLEPERSG